MKTPPGTPPHNEFFRCFFSPEPNIDLKTKSQPKKLQLVYVIFIAGAIFLEGGLIQPPLIICLRELHSSNFLCSGGTNGLPRIHCFVFISWPLEVYQIELICHQSS